MTDKPKSMFLPILAAVVLGGLGRMVAKKKRDDRRIARAARQDLDRKVSDVMRGSGR